jgi:hypothetical protein
LSHTIYAIFARKQAFCNILAKFVIDFANPSEEDSVRKFTVFIFCSALITPLLHAAIIYDSGNIAFSPTGTQFGRISRDGVASDWSGPKTFPGVTGAPTARAYEVITVNSGPFPFLQISFDDPAALLFDAAYIASYAPVNSPPNYGLNVNYLGDPGITEPFGNPTFFQILVAPHTNVLIPINEINPGGGTGATFDLLVEGFFDTAFNDIPEPSPILLIGCGAGILALLRWKKHIRGEGDGL